MSEHQPLHLPPENQLQQLLETFLPVVHARTEVSDDFGSPSLSGAVGLECGVLAVEVGFLVVGRYSRIADGRRCLI